MRRIVSIALLTTSAALAGCASSPATDSHLASFCHGYIQKGLGELPVQGVDRNAMWLSWNEVVPTTLFAGQMDQASFQEGRDRVSNQMAMADVDGIEDIMEDECDQGDNPLWRWW